MKVLRVGPAEDTEIVNYVAADAGGNIWLAADRKQPSGGRWQSGNLEKHGPSGKLEWTTSLDGSPVKALLSTASGEALVLVDFPMTLIRVSAAGDALWRKDLPHFFLIVPPRPREQRLERGAPRRITLANRS